MVQMRLMETEIVGSYRRIGRPCCSRPGLNECGKLLFPLSLKHLAGPLIHDQQAHFSLVTSGGGVEGVPR